MTKEQEEAIKYLEKQINYFKEQIKFIEAVDCDYYDEEYKLYKNRVKQFETVLNMLKEKELEIEKYKKIINLMTEHIVSSAIVDDTVCAIKCDCETDIEEDCTHEKMINCTKQHFERKAKYGR